ncbi:MAG TPA: Lrp/AsnC family transcriptional regulator [Marmoricola sp.]
MTSTRRTGALDEVSRTIIEQLQQDGRRSYAAIAKVIGLSEAAVRQRVQRLVDSGVIQVVAITNPLRLGAGRQATIGVRVDGEIEPVADALAAIDEVDSVVITAGSFDLLLGLAAGDDEHLLDVLSGRIRSVPGVTSTETFLHLATRKAAYSWRSR